MSRITKLLEKILRGRSDSNIGFSDLCTLLSHLGFAVRVRGDHHIFTKDEVAEILNLQPRSGKAKNYQVKQARNIILRYGLGSVSEEEGDKL